MQKIKIIIISFLVLLISNSYSQYPHENGTLTSSANVKVGAEKINEYLPLIKNKNVLLLLSLCLENFGVFLILRRLSKTKSYK